MSTAITKLKPRVRPKEERKTAVRRKSSHQKQQLFFNRELSWVEFNRRVLDEAFDQRHPLLERLKFLAIFSSNLDEFFMVRVSGLQEALEAGLGPSPDGMTPKEQLKEISNRLRPLIDLQTKCLETQILPSLEAQGIEIRPYRDLKRREKKIADDYFLENVFPILTPQAVDPGHPFPYVSNLSLNLCLMVSPPEARKTSGAGDNSAARFARIKLPPIVPRLVPIDQKGTRYTFLGSLLAANTHTLFPKMRTGKCHLFRVTRDADFEIKEDEAGDLLRTMQQHVRRLRFGEAARLEVAASMPAEMVSYLTKSLGLGTEDVYVINGPFNVPELMQLYELDRPIERSSSTVE